MSMEYYYSSMSSVWGEEMDKKTLSSITSKKQIDVNKRGRYCAGRWDDWGFFIDIAECFVWHFTCHTKIDLPNFRHFNGWPTKLQKCVVSPSTHEYFPSDDEYLCNVSLFFNDEPYCLICGPPYYKKWVKVTLTTLADDSRLRDAVTFCNGEKICTLFQNGRLGIIQMTTEITTCLSHLTFRAPTDAAAMYRDRQLVSWQHRLFLVQRKFGSPSLFEVWEADFETKQFDRVFNLDGFIIFLCQGFSAATSSYLPQEKNQIYFAQGGDHRTLYAFHLGDQSFSTTKQFRVFSPHNSVPLFARSERAKIQHNSSSTRCGKLKKRPSSSKNGINSLAVDSNICIHLPVDLQRDISCYLLSQEAYMSFRLVCKLWRSIAPPLRWKVVDHAAPSYDQDSMWLLSLNQKDGLCTFYNPFRNLNCYMSNNDLVGCEIRYAKDGWLLVSRGKSVFLFKPSPLSSGKQVIHLPQRTEDYFCDTMSFSATPTNSSAWVIFGIAFLDLFQLRISYLRKGDDKWTSITVDNEVPFLLSCSSPVYFSEKFYVISLRGDVGTFGFLNDGSPYWVIHQLSQLYSPPVSVAACRFFLVQRDQNVLHSVVVTQKHDDVHVYELDFAGGNQPVRLVKQVKNWLLFTSEVSSVAVCGMNVNVDDAVFFPTFNTCNDYTYYSLEDAAFKVLKDNSTDKTQQKELLNRVWIRCELTWN